MSAPEIVITPRDRNIATIFFIIAILAFMAFVVGMALAEYNVVEYARKVVSELPTYLAFAIFIIIIYLAAWIGARGKVEKTGIWKYS